MAIVTITGLTASRMIEIEQSSVVSGTVEGDNLVLTTRGGSPITAGNVRGPKGVKGDPGGVVDATTTSNGGVRLAGNLTGTANSPQVTGALSGNVDTTLAKVTPTGGTALTLAAVAKQAADAKAKTDTLPTKSVAASGTTTTLWVGTQSQYDALAGSTKNAAGFVAVIRG